MIFLILSLQYSLVQEICKRQTAIRLEFGTNGLIIFMKAGLIDTFLYIENFAGGCSFMIVNFRIFHIWTFFQRDFFTYKQILIILL